MQKHDLHRQIVFFVVMMALK